MIAIIGAGSIGGYVAWQLVRAGQSVVLGVHRPFEQLVVEDESGAHAVAARVLTDPSALAPADWVVLATKAHQTPAAAGWLAAACGSQTRAVVVLQNGVEHAERLAPFVGATPTLPAVVSIGAEVLSPGRIRHHAYSNLEVPDVELGRAFAALLTGSAISVTAVPDFRSTLWRKLISNVTASPITALTGRRIEVMADPAVRELAVELARECIAVARAEGAAIALEAARDFVDGMAKNAAAWPPFGSSMLYDRIAGRETEHEALTGAVVRIGARHGIPTPLNAAMLSLLRAAAPL
ncbi:MAG: 2-dehydropantoate 2-reductase [Deltaproteobacteria bacterium]|nr:2-dehydropantoate 2-reductase [Deltaproteobacteria bacterium]